MININALGSHQTLCLTKSLVLRSRKLSGRQLQLVAKRFLL